MVEAHLRQSPLAHLGLVARAEENRGEAGIALAEAPRRVQLALRGDGRDPAFIDAVREVVGLAPPLAANTVGRDGESTILWLGPDEWLVTAPAEAEDLATRLRAALAETHHAVADVTESRVILRLSGPAARDLLAQGCSLDFHASVFQAGMCAGSHLALAHVTIHQTAADPVYEIHVHRSFADYLWRWLETASEPYGFAVVGPSTA